MSISPRQLELIQGAAQVLVVDLDLTHEEAVQLIVEALKLELGRKQTTMEVLQVSSRAERTSFVRAAVADVEERLLARRLWQPSAVRHSVEKFMQILHDSWAIEG